LAFYILIIFSIDLNFSNALIFEISSDVFFLNSYFINLFSEFYWDPSIESTFFFLLSCILVGVIVYIDGLGGLVNNYWDWWELNQF
jgi:hypothetical protein